MKAGIERYPGFCNTECGHTALYKRTSDEGYFGITSSLTMAA